MISQEFLSLLIDLKTHMHTDYTTIDQCLYNLSGEWNELKALWKRGTKQDIQTMLFNIARRGYEVCSLLSGDKQDIFYFIESARELHEKKNAGYSGIEEQDPWKNFRECEEFDIPAADGCLTRLCDKYRRFFTVRDNVQNEKVGESLIDTMMDLSAYSLILICLLNEENWIW